MKNYYKQKTLIAVLLLFQLVGAANYYLDATLGTDSNSGQSEENPWKTIDKMINYQLQPDDSIFFKRGEIWRELFYVYDSGSEENPIYFGAYGDGEKPIISAIDTIPDWNNATLWTDLGNNIWSFSHSFNPMRLLINNTEVLKITPWSLIDSTNGFWCHSDETLYLYSTKNPALRYSSIEGNKLYYNVRIRDEEYLVFENLDLQGGSGNTVAIFGSRYITFTNCKIGRYGWIGLRTNPYEGKSTHHVNIINNIFDSGFHFIYGPPEERGVEDGILITAGAYDCLIESNQILDWGHNGVSLYALYEGDTGVYNNIIRYNYISGENNSYMRGIGTDGRENLCRDNEFYNNLIQNTTVRNQINGNHNIIHHNIIDGMTNSPVKSSGTAQGFDLQCYGTETVCHDNKIENNTIINCEEAGIRIRNNGDDKIDNYIRNNIIINCGTNSKDNRDNFGIVIDDDSSVKANIFQNNCIFNDGINEIVYYRGETLTVAQFNNNNGENNDTISNNIQCSPELDEDWQLSSGSCCIDAGLLLGYESDYYKNSIPIGNSADIGACEYQSETSIKQDLPILAAEYSLYQNWPNPFNPVTTIKYTIPEKSLVELSIYNLRGKLVKTLISENLAAGEYSAGWNASGFASGLYFYQLKTNNITLIKKCLLMK